MGQGMRLSQRPRQPRGRRPGGRGGSTELGMFLGNDGGIFGVGAPEIALCLLVGYFVLGPTDLYKAVKEVGKLFQSVQTLSAEATKNFESSMENTVALDELRKTQRDLNEAFSFRRSINQDEESSFDNRMVDLENTEINGATNASSESSNGEGVTKKKKRRRRVKKKAVAVEDPVTPPSPLPEEIESNVPDLDASDAFASSEEQALWEEDAANVRATRMERLEQSGAADWFAPNDDASGMAEEVLAQQDALAPRNDDGSFALPTTTMTNGDGYEEAAARSRFATQTSGDWNQSILDNEDKLSPLSKIMERLAILEEEKNAADQRLEEEFRLRGELEEKFYRQKREILEEAAAEIQADAYVGMSNSDGAD